MNPKIISGVVVAIAIFTAHQAGAYYSPSTGRWLSRDPMGEPGFELLRAASVAPKVGRAGNAALFPPSRLFKRDVYQPRSGINEYNFAQNSPIVWFDIDGRLSINACDTALNEALQSNAKAKQIVTELKKRKCSVPSPTCKCCSPSERGGGFDPATKKITICANAWSNGSGIIASVVHELTHALDDCRGTDWSNCKERACSEIRAYDEGGTCAPGGLDRQSGESYRDCIKRKATQSTTADPSCTAADVESQMGACLGSEL